MDLSQRSSISIKSVRQSEWLAARKALPAIALAAIIGLSILLRIYGLDWDRGHGGTPHPDERAILMTVGELSPPSIGQLAELFDVEESPWNPRWFPYGSFPLYLLKAAQVVLSALPGTEVHDLRVLGRALSALADVATVVVVYLLGSRLYDRRVGLLASAFLALAVIHIQLSHFYAVDTLLGLFTVVALYFLYGLAKEGRLRDSLLAGAFIGLGLATKISQAPIYIAFLVAHLVFLLSAIEAGRVQSEGLGRLVRAAAKSVFAGVAASLLVLVVVQPYGFLDWSRFLGDVVEQSEMVRRIRDYPYTRQYIDTTPYLYHIRQLATWGLGLPLGIIAWLGLVYASLRGMRLKYGLAYLGAGWALPAALLLYSTSLPAILVASAVAALALVATLPFRSMESRADVLMLSWVAPYFLIIGAFDVKFTRYLVPITPFLVLFGSRMLFAIWERAQAYRLDLRPWLLVGLALAVGATGFYAASYMSIYGEPHTALRTSDWLKRNAPQGSLVLREHWEEGIPNLRNYRVRELQLYEEDTLEKLGRLATLLADADYIWFYSNRLYGTIPRLPERYPVSTEYYRRLFSGALGYELVAVETAYPRLAGVTFVDDTFVRPGLATPAPVAARRPSGLTLNLGHADESFSVYDHPMGLVFQNVERHDAETIIRIILGDMPATALTGGDGDGEIGLLLSPQDLAAQQRGGTWTEIIRPESWTNRYPGLAWLLFVEVAALLVLPVCLLLFRPLPDRGYLFSKALGLLAVTLVVWVLASAHWMTFSRGSVGIALLVMGAVSAAVLAGRWRQLVELLRGRWPLLLVGELLFLVAFMFFVAIRMANPDLWHPHLGGEKPMDVAYLNAVLRSSYMPPYDPWFGGGYLNYYYWGQLTVATVIKATGIKPEVAFNLAVALFFALTVAGAYTIVYNLAEGTRRGMASTARRWSPVLAGVGGAAFVTVLGNLDGAVQVLEGVWRTMFQNLPFWYPRGEFDFWRSSRMMPPGSEITEFPFFTFLFADLHAHMMAIPFTLLAMGLSLAVLLARRGWSLGELVRLATLGVVVGSLRLLNTWDFPTYLIVAAAAVFLAEYFRHGGLGLVVLLGAGAKAALVFLVGYVVFLPYHLSYETFFDSVEATTNQTVLWQFLGITGLFTFVIVSFFLSESSSWVVPSWRALQRGFERVGGPPTRGHRGGTATAEVGQRTDARRVFAIAVAVAALGFVLATTVSAYVGSTVPFLVVMATLVAAVGVSHIRSLRGDAPHLAFATMIVLVALGLAIGLDVFRVEGDIDRMNSVFKFYLQIWVLLALSSAYLLWRMAHGRRLPLGEISRAKKGWVALLVALIVGASIYPILGTQVRLRARFNILPPTLNGMEYMRSATYGDRNGQIQLASDYEGITWLRENVQGSPIVLEGVTPIYRWGGRISVYTGLPSVVGWQWHQEQQRWGYRSAIADRARDVKQIYSTTDASEALSLLHKYGVKYVYVGQLERLYYPDDGLRKFEGDLSEHLDRVYQNDHVKIYRVQQSKG